MLNFRRVIYKGVASRLADAPAPSLPEIVLAGRSNAGKSSLVNALANHRSLAKVSSRPGKTQLVVYFDIDEQALLVDLPGYGYAQVSQEAKKRFAGLADAYFQAQRPLALVLLLVDIRHEPSRQDVQMVQFLQSQSLPFALVLAKADKLSRSAGLNRRQKILQFLKLPSYFPAFLVSAPQKQGLDELKAYLSEVVEKWELAD